MNEVYYAPIEIESPEQLETLHITWADVRTWHVGPIPVRVYPVPADRETSEYLTAELRAKYYARYESSRCMVPGTRKALIRCPSENKCAACPYGRFERETSSDLSLDALQEEGFDQPSTEDPNQEVSARMELEEILSRLNAEDPRLVQIIELKSAGYSVEEISARVSISAPAVYRALKKIRTIAESCRD